MSENKTVFLHNIQEVEGEKFLELEISNGTASGSTTEVILHFTNGKELLIFVHDDGSLHIEGD